MRMRGRQFFFFASVCFLPVGAGVADLDVGKTYSVQFVDINGHNLSVADGHVDIVTIVTRETWPKAESVGDRLPDQYLGDLTHRFITVVNFGKHNAAVRAILTAGARWRLAGAAKRVQPRYAARNLTRDPQEDIFAVADFDGTILSRLGVPVDVTFRVFVFGRTGQLLGQWNE